MLLVTELLDDAQAAREELSVRLVRQQLDCDRDRGEVVQLAQSIACDSPNERALLGVAHDLSHQRAGVGSAAGQHAREEASAPASKAWETLQHRSKVLLVSGLEEASRGDHRDDRGFVVQRPGDRVGIGRHAHAGKHHDRFTAGLRRACLEHRCYARQIGCGHGAHHRCSSPRRRRAYARRKSRKYCQSSSSTLSKMASGGAAPPNISRIAGSQRLWRRNRRRALDSFANRRSKARIAKENEVVRSTPAEMARTKNPRSSVVRVRKPWRRSSIRPGPLSCQRRERVPHDLHRSRGHEGADAPAPEAPKGRTA